VKTLFKLVLLLVLVGAGVGAYVFWDNLTPGERYHMVDKARSGDIDGLKDNIEHKAGEEIDRQKDKAAEVIKDIGNKAVDAAADGAKQGIDAAADDAKKGIKDQVEDELKKQDGPDSKPASGSGASSPTK
jgi:hypothetical protein